MNDERTDLKWRAARHAALADPVRLRIVDLLELGDRSPGELRARLGVASNLLAHHLGVLEAADVVIRTRSEGDRRRSYVRLRPDALTRTAPDPVLRARRIVFVCTGNAARSPLAAALWTATSAIPAASGGTHPAARASAGAIAAAHRHGLDLGDHTPRRIGQPMDGDLVVTVCDRAHEELGPAEGLHWSVPDPGRPGAPSADQDAAHEDAFQEIARRVDALAPRIAAVG